MNTVEAGAAAHALAQVIEAVQALDARNLRRARALLVAATANLYIAGIEPERAPTREKAVRT